MKKGYRYSVPELKKSRLIINTDAKNEADDQFAIVHALLSPQIITEGIIGAHFGEHRTQHSAQESTDECNKVLDLMELTGKIPVAMGAKRAVKSETEYEYSAGAEMIVREAMKKSKHKLFVIFLGPLTDLACAYLKEPQIADKLTAIWIGGGKYPKGNPEFNLHNDIVAANIIMKSNIELWQVPSDVYQRMQTGLAELQLRVYPYGKIGKYLFEQMVEFNNLLAERAGFPHGESWCLGDSPAVGLIFNPHNYAWEERNAPLINEDMSYSESDSKHIIRVYNDIDSRYILEDFFSKLALNYEYVDWD